MGTVTKALSLLAFFNHERAEIGLSEFTRLSGMNKATVYRMLTELLNQGFVEQTGHDRAYRLGPEVLRLAALREAAVPMLTVSRGILDQVSDQTGETAHVSLRQGDRLTSLAYVYSPRHATKVTMDDAEVLAFHATGSGLAVLAFAEDGFADRILAAPLPALTADTCTNPDILRRSMERVRRDGFAESVGGFEADVHSLAVPVFGPDRIPVGALAVAAPIPRMTTGLKASVLTALWSGTQELTRQIGGFFPDNYPSEPTK